MLNHSVLDLHFVRRQLGFVQILVLLIVLASGCEPPHVTHSGPLAGDITWQDVKDWNEFSAMIAQRDKIDEVQFIGPDRTIRLHGVDAKTVLDGLSEESSCP